MKNIQNLIGRESAMKKALTGYVCIAIGLAMTSLTANGASAFYSGSISASTLGSPVTTTLPMFNGGLGTLTGVQVTLNFNVTPFAQAIQFSGSPQVFTSAYAVSCTYSPSDIWTISHGLDSWNLAAPTVTTGNIYGSGQVVPSYPGILTFIGGTSAPANLTGASGADLPGYIGGGSLVFGTTGPGTYSETGGMPFFGGGGADLAGTASVTYTYTAVPEPATLTLLGLGGLAVMLRKRR